MTHPVTTHEAVARQALPRSYLYVPGDQPQKLAGAGRFGADAIIADLEDSVLPSAKEAARHEVAHVLSHMPTGATPWWVRVNAGSLEADLESVVCDQLAGIVLAKAEPERLHEVVALLDGLERLRGLGRRVPVLALLESARGVFSVVEIAEHERVVRLGLGEVDLAAELGLRPGPSREQLWPIRLQVVLASAAAGIAAPVGATQTSLDDEATLIQSTRLLLSQGFRARTAVHPKQVDVINDVFTPSDEEMAEAQKIVDALGDAQARGAGVGMTASSEIVDAAVVRAARDVLARGRATARSLNRRSVRD
ncbi:MAG TPA: CoA ester lyase [Actinomycetales bacterium]|nr:CoA ester lyase [Actinomycetales bacterium]